ncbi:unnamed protein product [Paramecium sonneborni]|uniref:Uncharacterized protein n=1 Tax=Paramecium sonneborni TaxID=65129 RepID=A0A8S1R5T3_9CILI|nr:unnamed protein product [Paramecium sonneborni]CAD8122779.1 unnamed protein product [Paramecium sonneborni]
MGPVEIWYLLGLLRLEQRVKEWLNYSFNLQITEKVVNNLFQTNQEQMASLQQMDSRSISEFQNGLKESQSDLKISQCQRIVEEKGKKYMKVSFNTKQQLYYMVQRQGMKIKDAAEILGIKYATAKTIIFLQREKRRAKRKCGERMCGYTEIIGKKVSRVKIICIIANEIVQQEDYKL